MKKFVTLLVLGFLGMQAVSASAQTVSVRSSDGRSEVIRVSSKNTKSASPIPFVSKGGMVLPFAAPQDLPDDELLGYFDVDMDANGEWFNFPLPDTLEYSDGTQVQKRELGTRFSTQLDNPVLDSVLFRFIAFSVDETSGKGIKATIRPTGWFGTSADPDATMPFPNGGSTIGSSVNIPFDQITLDDPETTDQFELTNLILPFGKAGAGQQLKVGTKWIKEFCVMLNAGAATTTNSISVLTDQMSSAGHAAGDQYDTTTDRAYWIGYQIQNGVVSSQWTAAPMAGAYVNQNQEQLFPNFIMVAWLHNAPASDVEVSKLSGNALGINYPNPVATTTDIPYSVAERSYTSVKVFNTLGNLVSTVVDGYVDAGYHTASFNASNLANGTYYYTITVGNFTATKSMIVAH